MHITASAFLEWLLGIQNIQDIKQGYAVIVSSVIVIIGWYFSRLGQIKSDRVKNTSAFVTVLRDKETSDAIKKIGPIVNNKEIYVWMVDDDLSKAMTKVLAQLEYQAAAVRLGLISERYINKMERTFIHTVFKSISKHTDVVRRDRGSNTIYENIETLFIRSYIGKGNIIINIIEFFSAQPRFDLSLIDFRTKYYIVSNMYDLNKNYLLEDWNSIKNKINHFNRLSYFIVFLIIICLIFAKS